MAKKKVKKKKRSAGKKVVSVKKSSKKVSGGTKKSTTPGFVRVISILYYIVSVLMILMGVVLFIGGFAGEGFVKGFGIDRVLEFGATENPVDSFVVPLILGSLIVGGLLVIAIGILEFYIARGLWLKQNWARILVVVFAVIGFIAAIPIFDWGSLIINALIGSYMWFNKGVKRTFR